MPVSKKRKKALRPEPEAAGGGLLGKMRGGVKNLAGASAAKKKESPWSKALTWALVLLAAYFLARRFGVFR